MQQLTHRDIVRLFGDLNDHVVVEILEAGANLEQLEEAAAWLEGENDLMGDARLPLEGPAARVYGILVRDRELVRQGEGER
jgi:hypothetical protein